MSGIGNTESDPSLDRHMAKIHEENATNNAQQAIKTSQETKEVLTERVNMLEAVCNNILYEITDLNRKYNLLLSERFNGGSTVEEDGDNS